MTHKQKRKKMDEAIKLILVPFLRDNHFKGSYPNFRRESHEELQLLTFQFHRSEPKFVVEISNCSKYGFTTSWGEELKPAECRVDFMGKRLRIGSIKHDTDYWYDFDKAVLLGNVFHKRAKEVIDNWQEAEEWWKNNPFQG